MDVCNGVKEFFGFENILKELNGTFLSLISKKSRADSLDLFRPISLCNYFYKIISKVLTLRIMTLLPHIISKQQNRFIPGRQIVDSIITVHENIHSLSVSKKVGCLIFLKPMKEWIDIFSSRFWKLLALVRDFVISFLCWCRLLRSRCL